MIFDNDIDIFYQYVMKSNHYCLLIAFEKNRSFYDFAFCSMTNLVTDFETSKSNLAKRLNATVTEYILYKY